MFASFIPPQLRQRFFGTCNNIEFFAKSSSEQNLIICPYFDPKDTTYARCNGQRQRHYGRNGDYRRVFHSQQDLRCRNLEDYYPQPSNVKRGRGIDWVVAVCRR
jgi:hypothetical protein